MLYPLVFEKNQKTVKSDQREPQNVVPEGMGAGLRTFYNMI